MVALSTADLTEAAVTWVSKEFSKMVVAELKEPTWANQFDVVAITPNAKFVQIIEVKRTRSDFLRGKKEGQFERYMDYCHQFFLFTPAGLLEKSEVPKGAGLIEAWTSGVVRRKLYASRRPLSPERYLMMISCVLQKLIVEGHRWSQETTRKQQHESYDRRWKFQTWLDQHEGRRYTPLQNLRRKAAS